MIINVLTIVARKSDIASYEDQMCRSACALTQSDQHLNVFLAEKYNS